MNLIYHGTSAVAARVALTEGLRPRGNAAGNDWLAEFPSIPDWIYLTKDAPLYYAAVSVNRPVTAAKTGAVIRIDSDALDKSLLRPDEDYFHLQNPPFATREEIKAFHDSCKERARQNPGEWTDSLSKVGSVGYAGVIPPNAIIDVVFVDFTLYGTLHGALLQVGEKVADRSQVLDIHGPLMLWLYSRNRLQLGFIDRLVGLAAENMEMPISAYRIAGAQKIHNLRKRNGLAVRGRPTKG
jgi:hypothetical protein